jgi:hypothetical protein
MRPVLQSITGIWTVLLFSSLTACVWKNGIQPFPPSLQDTSLSSGDVMEEEEPGKSSPLGVALLYIPNRIFDAAEMLRLGVNVGIGLGVDARATWMVQAAAIQDTSVGIGYQGLRRLPVCKRVGHSVMGAGPIKSPRLGLYDWPVNDHDVRLELFIFLLGAHVAIDFEAIYDFLGGLLTFDFSEDDFTLDERK